MFTCFSEAQGVKHTPGRIVRVRTALSSRGVDTIRVFRQCWCLFLLFLFTLSRPSAQIEKRNTGYAKGLLKPPLRLTVSSSFSLSQTRWKTPTDAYWFIVKQGFHAQPLFVWHTWWRRNVCAWTRLLSSSSSDAVSSPPTSASWVSCCSLSHRCWPRHAQWRQLVHQPPWAPSLPHPATHPSSSASLWGQWGRTGSPAASRTCRVPSPPHQAADKLLRPQMAKPF